MSTAGRCMACSTSSGTVVGPGMARNSRPARTLIVLFLYDSRALLLVEAEVHQVVVLHHVGLGLDAHLVRMLCGRFAAGGDEVVEADDLRPDESFLDVGVNRAARLLRRRALADQPGAI